MWLNMKANVCTKAEMEANIQLARSMREAAKLCNMTYTSFRRYAKQYGIYEPNKPTRLHVKYCTEEVSEPGACRFCNKPCKNQHSLSAHERSCPKNPNRTYVSHTIGHTAWNKGLTKETNVIVAGYAEKIKDNYASGKVTPYFASYEWTDERRKQQSERKKQLYKCHPEKHPNALCAGNKCKMTYPEQVTYEWLVSYGYKVIHNYHFVTSNFNRYVDFYVPRYNLFIEVDGEHWHKNKAIDIEKDIDAKHNGKITLRLIPKKHITNQLCEYFSELKYG